MLKKAENNLIIENNNLKNIKSKLSNEEKALMLNTEDYENILKSKRKKKKINNIK